MALCTSLGKESSHVADSGERCGNDRLRLQPGGGFVGEADYEGNLTEFVPFLKAAEWTGVGRHTVWGKGAILIGPV